MSHSLRLRNFAIVLLAATIAGCDLGVSSPEQLPTAGTVTVDASADFAYVGVDGDALVSVTPATPATSTEWLLGLFGTTITSNGGAAGPGGVEIACLCANAAATNAEVMAMSPASELGDFESVTADAATTATFGTDELAPAINGWYSGTGATASVVAGRSWIVRRGTTTVLLGKLRVLSITNPTVDAMGTVSLEFAMQAAAGEAFGAVDTLDIDVGTTPIYVNLSAGSTTTTADWDLQLDGWTIRVNSGVSGSGSSRTVLDTATPFEDITATYAGFVPAQAYSSDAFTGVFAAQPWYRYNLTGTDHQIWPTFQVYLVRRAELLFKVQITSYYGPAGETRQITLRYQRLAQ